MKNLAQNIQKVVERISCLVKHSSTSSRQDRVVAAHFVDRVLEVVKQGGKDGCLDTAFVPKFNLDEMDLVDHTLLHLRSRQIIKKEIRYFMREEE